MNDKKKPEDRGRVSRRAFVGGGVGVASLLASAPGGARQSGPAATTPLPTPSAAQLERDVGGTPPPSTVERAAQRPGSDLMVQVLRDLGIEYVAANPASSFEGLQESIVDYDNPPNAKLLRRVAERRSSEGRLFLHRDSHR